MGYECAHNPVHVNCGLVLGMSTRKGVVIFLDQFIKEAASAMHAQMRKNEEKYANVEEPEATAEEIALSGIKIQDMSAKRYVAPLLPSVSFD